MIATIIDCEEIETKVRKEPALRFKVEIETEIHYIYLSLFNLNMIEDVCKHLHIPIIRKRNGHTIASVKSLKDKMLPVDEDRYRNMKYFRIAFNRLNR